MKRMVNYYLEDSIMNIKHAMAFIYFKDSCAKFKYALCTEQESEVIQKELKARNPIHLNSETIKNHIDFIASELGHEYLKWQKVLYAYPSKGTYAPEVERTITVKEEALKVKRDALREQLKELFAIQNYLENL